MISEEATDPPRRIIGDALRASVFVTWLGMTAPFNSPRLHDPGRAG